MSARVPFAAPDHHPVAGTEDARAKGSGTPRAVRPHKRPRGVVSCPERTNRFAIGLAAAVGGFTYDNLGINGIFLAAAGISVMAALLIAVSFSLFARDTGHKA